MVRLLSLTAAFLLSASAALAAPAVPGRAALKGDLVKMNQQFHLLGYNYRIVHITWVPATDAFVQKTADYASGSTAPNGALIFKVPAKNTQSSWDYAPALHITVQYKDGTQADGYDQPFLKSGTMVHAYKIQPGQGMTFYYIVDNVPQPTHDNPVVKLLLKNTSSNDKGFPPVYRMLHPVISP